MEITKEKLISLLSENYSSDIEEAKKLAARREKPVEKIDLREPIFENGRRVGWSWRKDIKDPNSELITVLFLCGRDIEEFKETHKEIIEHIDQKFKSGWYFTEDACPSARPEKSKSRKYYNPTTGLEDDPFTYKGYDPTKSFLVIADGEVVAQFTPKKDDKEKNINPEELAEAYAENYRSSVPGSNVIVKFDNTVKLAQENIKRTINSILVNEFEKNEDFVKMMNIKSLPPIFIRDLKFIDRHVDKWTNDKLELRYHSFNAYKSAKEFLTAVIKRSRGVTGDNMHTFHLARQFNTKYQKWLETKPSERKFIGKTKDIEVKYVRKTAYDVDAGGYKEPNFDVTLKMLFEVIGERIGNGFVWTIKIQNKFGRKKPDDYVIQGLERIELQKDGLFDGKMIVATKTVQLPPNAKFDNVNTIMQNKEIVNGLMETIENFKNQIKQINEKDMIKIANVKRSDVERVDEQRINKLIKKTIMEMAK